MGDYNAIIVQARIKKVDNEIAFKDEVLSKLGLCDSAYHQTDSFIRFENNHLTMVTQVKYGRGIKEFIEWLHPYVIGGLGPNDAWLIDFSEYTKAPSITYMSDVDRDLY